MLRRAFVGLVFCAIVAGVPPTRAQYFITSDTPATLGGTVWQPWDVVRDDAGAFSLAVTFPAGTAIDGVHHMTSGDWLISVSEPTSLGGVAYDPRDVIRYDGATYARFFDGAAAGIPATVNVDSVFLSGGDAGDLIVGFDGPVVLGGTTYGPSDLARFHAGTFTKFFDASTTSPPIPATTNVLDADERAGVVYLSLDVPTTLGSQTFLPGDVVSWNGSAFALRFRTGGWPPGGAMTGLALGSCLDGDGDGFGDPGEAACAGGPTRDCNDIASAIYPGSPQLCDGINNDCNDPSWPTVPANEANADGDGYRVCAGDCLDTNPSVYPGAPQLCDGINNNCSDPAWPIVPANEADADGDGVRICAGDCNDADAGLKSSPSNVGTVTATKDVPIVGSMQFSWSSLDGVAGTSTNYDVARGLLSALRAGGFPGGATCAANDLLDTPYSEVGGSCPAGLGDGCWYLFRAQNSCGTGSYGSTGLDNSSPCP